MFFQFYCTINRNQLEIVICIHIDKYLEILNLKMEEDAKSNSVLYFRQFCLAKIKRSCWKFPAKITSKIMTVKCQENLSV